MPNAFEVGDWICWKAMDGLIIAEVHYIREEGSYPYHTELVTSKGVCRPADVLERRTKI